MVPLTVRSLPQEERPRERLMKEGADALSVAELLAIVLGSGYRGKPVHHLAQELLASFGSLEALMDASIEELCQTKGLGIAKAIQLKAASALGLRSARGQSGRPPRLGTPEEAYRWIGQQLEGLSQEVLVVLLLNGKQELIRHERVGQGTLSRVLVHPREVFLPAIRHKAAGLILAHNHPSGDPTPSQEDLQITRQLQEAGAILDIPLHDHLIIGRGSYVSLRERGLFH